MARDPRPHGPDPQFPWDDDPDPDEPWTVPGAGDGPPPRRWPITTIASITIVALGVASFLTTIGTYRANSAMLFVGLPTLLAVAIVLSPPARSVHGVTFKGLTLGLLVAAVLMHEGAICVLFAAPLVYLVGHLVVGLLRLGRRMFAIAPIGLILALEGLVPGLRVAPVQTVTVTHVVHLAPATVAWHIAAGPDFARAPRPWLLAMVPMPGHVNGTGVDPGDGWEFVFHGDSHGPGGSLVCAVTAHTRTGTAERVDFRRISDTSVVRRWLYWSQASLAWRPVATGTEVTLTMTFTRGLDPSWYFGPLEQVMVRSGAGLLLDALDLPDTR